MKIVAVTSIISAHTELKRGYDFSELELDESLLDALEDKGFTHATAIQAAAIPPALDGP
ncbi:hypothetical protein KCP77_08565 [Salmonella enterica subsp. enterica]|nr:hypothetical protein KCP77_08565 [Salmonella enterica subsp. enterica]